MCQHFFRICESFKLDLDFRGDYPPTSGKTFYDILYCHGKVFVTVYATSTFLKNDNTPIISIFTKVPVKQVAKLPLYLVTV